MKNTDSIQPYNLCLLEHRITQKILFFRIHAYPSVPQYYEGLREQRKQKRSLAMTYGDNLSYIR